MGFLKAALSYRLFGHSSIERNFLRITGSICCPSSRYDFDDIRERAIWEISLFEPPLSRSSSSRRPRYSPRCRRVARKSLRFSLFSPTSPDWIRGPWDRSSRRFENRSMSGQARHGQSTLLSWPVPSERRRTGKENRARDLLAIQAHRIEPFLGPFASPPIVIRYRSTIALFYCYCNLAMFWCPFLYSYSQPQSHV